MLEPRKFLVRIWESLSLRCLGFCKSNSHFLSSLLHLLLTNWFMTCCFCASDFAEITSTMANNENLNAKYKPTCLKLQLFSSCYTLNGLQSSRYLHLFVHVTIFNLLSWIKLFNFFLWKIVFNTKYPLNMIFPNKAWMEACIALWNHNNNNDLLGCYIKSFK